MTLLTAISLAAPLDSGANHRAESCRAHSADFCQALVGRYAGKVRNLRRILSVRIEREPSALEAAFGCIYRHERHPRQGWATNTSNGYFGGLQMDWIFQRTYGAEYLRIFGPAHRWPPSVQIAVAIRAWATRGFHPWPNTARACGLL